MSYNQKNNRSVWEHIWTIIFLFIFLLLNSIILYIMNSLNLERGRMAGSLAKFFAFLQNIMNKIVLNKKDGSSVQAEFKILDINYIDEILELQNDIYEGLENKEFYACSSREEFEEIINSKGKIIGCVSLNNNKLIAIGVYVKYGYEKHNYGYDVNISGEELLKVGQIESTIVLKDYRGNKLQKIICTYLENICKDEGMKWVGATVEPNNIFSLNTFVNSGYKIVLEKLKYGGLKRYVLIKGI